MIKASFAAQRECPLLMVVDDDDELREALALALRTRGFRTVEKADGQAALDYLRHDERPDLILLDLVMPEMDGWEFRDEQLRDAELADIPVVALSADESAKARAVHATAFVRKPVSPPALLSTIGEALKTVTPPQVSAAGAAPSRRSELRRARRPKSAVNIGLRDLRLRGAALSRTTGDRRSRVRAEAQCAHQLVLVSGGISHAVNNSLQCILAYLESIEVSASDLDLHASTLVTVEQCANTIARLSRSAPRPRLSSDAVLGESAIWTIVEACRSLCPPQVELRLANMQALADARVEPEAMHDILTELVRNALEARERGSAAIQLRAGKRGFSEVDLRGARPTRHLRRGVYCYVDVIDHGSGIRPNVLPYIFEPFFSTKFAGRGLGLSIVLNQVRRAGGMVVARSQLGVNTAMRVILRPR